jgi:hypothetical protein
MADFAFFSDETEYCAAPYALFELHFVHTDSYKVAARIIKRYGNVADLVNPFQEVAAEQKTVMVKMFRQYQFIGFHRSKNLVKNIYNNSLKETTTTAKSRFTELIAHEPQTDIVRFPSLLK